VIAALSQDGIFEVGAPVNLSFDPDKAHLFPEDGSGGKGSAH
jgi:hypothetical protein